MLLHLLLIALFGAPSGGSREGRAMWGSMQVELRGLLIEATPALPAAPLIETTAPAPADPFPTRSDRAPREGAVPLTPPADTQAGATAPSGPAIVEVPAPFPPLLDRLVRPEPRLDEPPPLRVPPPTSGRDLRPPPRERPAPAPAIEVPAPLPIVPAPAVERVLAEPPAIPAPVLQPVPAPAPQPRVAAPAEKTPSAETPLTRPIEAPPVEVRAVPVPAPLESAAIPRIDPTTAAVELAPTPQIQAAPAPAPPVEQVPPRAPAPPAKIDPETPRLPGDARPPLPSEFRRPGPARRSDEPSTSYDPTAPALDVDAIRNRAGQIGREGSGQRALLPFPMPAVPEKKSKTETAIENARKPDCRTAYQGLGLLAVVPLVANEFGEGTCRW